MGFFDNFMMGRSANNQGGNGNMQQPRMPQGQGNVNTQRNTIPNNTGNNDNGPGATLPSNSGFDNNRSDQNQNNQNTNQQQQEPHPLDAFAKMFDNAENKETPPSFTLDDNILSNVAKQQNFMQGIDPELVQKATNGDVGSLMQLMGEVSKNAYKASLAHSSKLTESFVAAREGHNEKGFTNKVRSELTVNALTGTPNFKNPVVRKQLTMVAENLQRQHPDAPPEEIAGMAREYIMELSKAIAPENTNEESSSTRNNRQPVDFEKWFENEGF